MVKLKHCNVETKTNKLGTTVQVNVTLVPAAVAQRLKVRYDFNDVATALSKAGYLVEDVLLGKTEILNSRFEEQRTAQYAFSLKPKSKTKRKTSSKSDTNKTQRTKTKNLQENTEKEG